MEEFTKEVRSFNSRSREGSDSVLRETRSSLSQVSIHAPVKGATDGRILIEKKDEMFQFTLP